jgi:outer membrane protein OmpA-like peptidoglycan-associated protein
MPRWLWALLGGVILVAIAAVFWTARNQTNVTPPVSPGPAPVAPAPAPPAPAPVAQEPAPSSGPAPTAQNAAPSLSQTPEKETAPGPTPQPATAPSSHTAEKETPPTPTATAPTSTASTSEKEAAPASSSAPVHTAPNEAAPPSAPQQAAAPTAQTAEKESAPASTPSPAPAPAAPAGEKAPAATDKDAEPHANDKASAELAALQPGFVPKDLVAALNDSVISFASDSADVPASMTDFLQKAAEDLKQLPKGHVVEIAGYTDNTGDQALNVALSQKRAEAVQQMLIKFGADPEMLVAKGYGSADPVASNDTPEGRRRNRRIEYHIVKTP